jgi:hypothetical protein
VLSLGHAFFAQAKKGGSLAAASETKGREDASTAPAVESINSRSLADGLGLQIILDSAQPIDASMKNVGKAQACSSPA